MLHGGRTVLIYTSNAHVARMKVAMNKVVVEHHFEEELQTTTSNFFACLPVAIKELRAIVK